MKTLPDFKFEIPLWEKGYNALGIDEAGRGAFAGPLSVGGAIFDSKIARELLNFGINDSKLLTPKKRESLYLEIKKHAIFSHVEFIDLTVINEIGIGKATFLGMKNIYDRAEKILGNTFCLIDAFKIPEVINQNAVIHGDRVSVSIAAASILAKVERDNLMSKLGKKYPEYGFEVHKGYGTLLHRNALKSFGASIHHRTQFIAKHI